MENAIKPRVLVENSLGDMHLTKCVLVAGKTQEHYGQLPAESQLWRQYNVVFKTSQLGRDVCRQGTILKVHSKAIRIFNKIETLTSKHLPVQRQQ